MKSRFEEYDKNARFDEYDEDALREMMAASAVESNRRLEKVLRPGAVGIAPPTPKPRQYRGILDAIARHGPLTKARMVELLGPINGGQIANLVTTGRIVATGKTKGKDGRNGAFVYDLVRDGL
jgi:hypothetical protein